MYTHSSEVATPVAALWNFVTTPEGMNYELRPLIRMTVPRTMRGRTVDDVEPGDHLGRSWLLLGGFVPFEFDDITVAELDIGRRFMERSAMGSIRVWQHERSLQPLDTGGTRITDSIEYELRFPLPGLERFTGHVLGLLFRHRHRRLSERFGPTGDS